MWCKQNKVVQKIKFIVLSFCLLIPIIIGLTNTSAGAETQKSLMMGETGLNFIGNPTILNSDVAWNGDYLHFGLTTDNKWRILEKSENQLLLYSDDTFYKSPYQIFDDVSNVYETSDIRSFLQNAGFSSAFPDSREQALVVPTTIAAKNNTEFNTDGSHIVSDWTDGGVVGTDTTVSYTNPGVNGDKLFLLSVDEITNPNYGFYRNGSSKNKSREASSDNRYWLRSGDVDEPKYPAFIDCYPKQGQIANNYEYYSGFEVMAAAHIDTSDILFVSSAIDGKLSGPYGADALADVTESSTNDFKFTLTDPNLKLSLSNVKRTGNKYSFNYTASGTANNISAIVLDSANNIVSYGRIKDISSAENKNGSAEINLPADFDSAGYTLKVFPEEYHGDNATDYAGETILVEESQRDEKYTVTFKNDNGEVLRTEQIPRGEAATAPSDPEKEGYTFIGWDKEFSNITEDTIVTATYKINTYKVKFLDYDKKVIQEETVNHGGTATAPSDPKREGYIFTGWDKSFSNVTNNLEVIAQYNIIRKQYEVIFKNAEGEVIKKEMVIEGDAATPPNPPEKEGYTFIGWSQDLNHITSDSEIFAQYRKDEMLPIPDNTDNETINTTNPINPVEEKVKIVDTGDNTNCLQYIFLMILSVGGMLQIKRKKKTIKKNKK